ncbi:MAG: (d)CMP kinase, partial [Chloroflexi bacterium]|nr:(d)CMP kinase [Chloroflexota bacterium]
LRLRIEVLPPTVEDGRQYTVLADGVDITWAIREAEVDRGVSPVSAYAGVREALVAQQRRIGREGGVVMVGRDIGTVVFPEAEVKIYLDASPEERARRRYRELQQRGVATSYEEVLADLKRRDGIDSTRAVAPLRPAQDAVIVDSTLMTVEEVVARVLEIVKRALEALPCHEA